MTNLGNGKKESRFESLLVAQKGENAHWSLVRFEISLAHWSLVHCKCANGILKVTQYLISLFVSGRILLQNRVCILCWGDSWQHVQSGQTRASELHSNGPSSIEPHQFVCVRWPHLFKGLLGTWDTCVWWPRLSGVLEWSCWTPDTPDKAQDVLPYSRTIQYVSMIRKHRGS